MNSRLKIDQQFAQIDIKVTPAKLNITMPRRKMKIVQETPVMEIDIDKPSFEINMKKVRNESGLKDPLTLMRSIRNTAKMRVNNYTGQSVRDGDYIGDVTRRGNRIAEIFRAKSLRQSNTEINIGLMPKASPEVEWDKGGINIKWSRNKFKIEWEGKSTPEIVVDPKHSVEVFLRNRPSVTITIEEAEELKTEAKHIDALL